MIERRFVLVAAATALALIGTVAVYGYAHSADKRAVAGTRAIQVLIANKQVPADTTWQEAVKGGYLKLEKIPEASAPESALATLDAGVPNTAVASSDISSGQIVLRQMFGVKSAVTGVLTIPKHMIAISVTMPSNADVAGFVAPRSEVAVFATFPVSSPDKGTAGIVGSGQYVTKLLLPRVLVAATSQAPPTNAGGAKAGEAAAGGSVLVTLAVTQAQAQRIILAQQAGQLYFGLLSSNSITAADGGVTNLGTLQPTSILAK
jgi:pilus assembly protein CpaB